MKKLTSVSETVENQWTLLEMFVLKESRQSSQCEFVKIASTTGTKQYPCP